MTSRPAGGGGAAAEGGGAEGGAASPPGATGVLWACVELKHAAVGLCGLLRDSMLLRRLSVGVFLLMWGVAGGFSILNNFTLAVYNWQQGDLQVARVRVRVRVRVGVGVS